MGNLTKFENSEALCRYVAERSNGVCLLSFSRGKDSVASWLQCKKYFETIYPVYFYRVPGLRFVEESLAYFEERFETRIIRLPHPATYSQLSNLMFQAPQNVRKTQKFGFEKFTYAQAFDFVREDLDLGDEVLAGVGARMSDNPLRKLNITQSGSIHWGQKKFYPVYDWNNDRLMRAINDARVRLPVDYDLFGRSFDGIKYTFLKPIKEHYPDDYERILELFPLAELELKQIEFREEYYRENR